MGLLEDAENSHLTFAEQVSAPATPAAGLWEAYFKSGGLYVKDDAGVEVGPLGTGSGGGGSGGGAVRLSDTIATDFTSTTNNAYTTLTGLTFTITPAADGVLTLNSPIRGKLSVAGSLYLRATISPAPVSGAANIGATEESMIAGKFKTLGLLGNWDLASGTAYTVTVLFFQTGGGTFTCDHSESELTGVFHLY